MEPKYFTYGKWGKNFMKVCYASNPGIQRMIFAFYILVPVSSKEVEVYKKHMEKELNKYGWRLIEFKAYYDKNGSINYFYLSTSKQMHYQNELLARGMAEKFARIVYGYILPLNI